MSITRAGAGDSPGMILVVVLWVVAMMTVVVVALSAYSHKSLVLAGVNADVLRSEMALKAGIDVGKAMILASPPRERVFFNGAAVTVDVGRGQKIEVAIMDAAGLADINKASEELIESMVERAQLSSATAAAIVESVKQARQRRQRKKTNAVEKPLGQTAEAKPEKAPEPVPAEFFSTAQLYALNGADPREVDKLLPLITVYGSDGKVNPMAAPEQVMQSIPGLTREDSAILATARDSRLLDDQGMQEVLGRYPAYLATGSARVFVVSVKALAGSGLIAGSRMREVVMLNDTGEAPFQTLTLSW